MFVLLTGSRLLVDQPTSKFGEALRGQVEERLAFFETGAPPSKNVDAIRKVIDALAEEDDEDEEMADAEPIMTTLEATPKKDKKKKRKSEAMDVDEDDEDESEPVKKVKLSKDEKKALKKAKKEVRKAEEALAVGDVSCPLHDRCKLLIHSAQGDAPKKEKKAKKEKKVKA